VKLKRALFIDRDGIFHKLIPWGVDGELCAPRNSEELYPYSEIQGIEKAKELGFLLIMATNQPDVERGITERSFVEEVNERYRALYQLDAIYVCYHTDNNHPLKKPNPGMLLKAAEEHSIDLSQSFFLGDTWKDVEAAKKAGCTPLLWSRQYNQDISIQNRVSNIEELLKILNG
jgi:D-glycero-D-manno-heptose 1,7-bisphosphate phosphatase